MHYYDIKEAAQSLDVAPSTLRYWEKEGLIHSERQKNNDYRQYSFQSLIEASEVAFYRKLGVSIKQLKDYQRLTLENFDEALGRTEQNIEAQIHNLITMKQRLERQRELNACAKKLQACDLQAGIPSFKQLIMVDYAGPLQSFLFVDDPWRYGALIHAEKPRRILDMVVVDSPKEASETKLSNPKASDSWEYNPADTATQYLECLLRVDPISNTSNAEEIFSRAANQGFIPNSIVGAYLVSATEEADGPRWDYYHAWVVGEVKNTR